MEIYKFNRVFDHIAEMLTEYYSDDRSYDNTVFVLGSNVLPNLNSIRTQYPGYRVIVYQLEQLYRGSEWVNKKNYNILKSADEIWDYDHINIQWMRANYKINAKFHPMLYTESLRSMDSVSIAKPDIDVLFYGYIHERRAKMFYHLQHKMAGKYKFFNMFGIWGDELDEYISRSKIILNLHSNDQNRQEQARLFHPVINGRCVLSEKSNHNYFGDSIIEVPFDKMVPSILKVLGNGHWKNVALNSSDRFNKISDSYINHQ